MNIELRLEQPEDYRKTEEIMRGFLELLCSRMLRTLLVAYHAELSQLR